MTRYCYTLQIRPELLGEYRHRHASVWPDMLRALHDAGWRNYAVFVRADGLVVGYLETDDLERARSALAANDANRRWQNEMEPYLLDLDGGAPDEEMTILERVFSLDDQLDRLGEPAADDPGGPR